MTSSQPAQDRVDLVEPPYASFVSTSSRFTFAAAIVSGLPLNVPT